MDKEEDNYEDDPHDDIPAEEDQSVKGKDNNDQAIIPTEEHQLDKEEDDYDDVP